ncbi:hypothetical protein FY557_14045 [Chryseobacterium sp. SN22]|uniref:vitamin K epoxide reductase family protein n=1 Tax=Chryseobacterium sp. SN22 TaxID=2606431 RepID=UPI0011EF4DBC|nr:vitamin K epoxide reductase family protein [Chryseobacterium sp. SN22]KAA0127286.1 hypothetical protein FY557_14045 [Chryseobacterium sp. SN22]
MMLTQNLEAVFSYAKSKNIYLDPQEFRFQVETHPDYPSLLAFSDALSFFNIPNMAFDLPFDEIDHLSDSFVALLKSDNKSQQSNLYHITKHHNDYVYKDGNKSLKLEKDQLKPLWQNVVLLAERPEEYVEKGKSKVFSTGLISLLIIIFILGAVWFFTQSFILTIAGLLISIGLFLSIEALKVELGLESKISEGFCNIIVNADCGQVINSTKSKWLQKIKISDISIWFFTSQLLGLLIFSVSDFSSKFLDYLFILLIISIPMTFYSIYFQYKIEKKWCPICLSIIGTVYIELVCLFFLKRDGDIDIKTFFLFSVIFFIVAGLIYLLKPVLLERKYLNDRYIKQLRFVRNYEIFKNTLLKSEIENFEEEFIILGNRESKNKISIITSPMCGYCKDAHHILEKIISQHSNDIAISIRFNFSENFDEKTKNLFLRLGEIYEQKGDNIFIYALKEWFENKNFENWFFKFGKPENTNPVKEKLEKVTKENYNKGLHFTPNLFLNQYNYPSLYDRENLEFFIADWIEDNDL